MDKNKVVLYIANISDKDTQKLFEKYALEFDKERVARIGNCNNADSKSKKIASATFLYKVLNKYNLDMSQMAYSEHGKPFVANCDCLFFNLSHSADYAVIAIAGQPVGVDIQKKVPYKEGLVKRVCSEKEAELVREEFTDRFNYVWALKEAASKLSGEGLLSGMKCFVTDFNQENPEIFRDEEHFAYSKTMIYQDEYAIAVACREHFNIDDIIIMEDF